MKSKGKSQCLFGMFQENVFELRVVVVELKSNFVDVLLDILSKDSFEDLLLLFVRKGRILDQLCKHSGKSIQDIL